MDGHPISHPYVPTLFEQLQQELHRNRWYCEARNMLHGYRGDDEADNLQTWVCQSIQKGIGHLEINQTGFGGNQNWELILVDSGNNRLIGYMPKLKKAEEWVGLSYLAALDRNPPSW